MQYQIPMHGQENIVTKKMWEFFCRFVKDCLQQYNNTVLYCTCTHNNNNNNNSNRNNNNNNNDDDVNNRNNRSTVYSEQFKLAYIFTGNGYSGNVEHRLKVL